MAQSQDSQYFDGVEAAMEALPVPLEDRTAVREMVQAIEHSQVWINAARGYIALSNDGEKVSAYVNRTFVDVLDGGDYRRTELSRYRLRNGGPRGGVREGSVQTCPVHQVQLPATGVCDECD